MKLLSKALRYLFFCCVAVLAIAGCGAKKPLVVGAPAATDTTLHKLSVSAYEIANALDTGEKEFEALYSSNLPGVSDDDYAKTVAKMFLSAQSCNSSYTNQLKSLSTVDDSNRAQVIGWSNSFLSCVNTLINEGVVGIKNPDARQKIQTLLAPIPGAIQIIVDALGIPVASGARPCASACAALIFTEVKLGTRIRSQTHRPGYSVGGEPARILPAPQAAKRSYRSTALGRCRQDQRHGCDQDADVPYASQRRSLINPVREAWFFA